MHMRHETNRRPGAPAGIAALLALAFTVAAADAAGQTIGEPASRSWTVDFWASVGADVTSLSGELVSSHTPTLQNSDSGTGVAGQTLTLDSGSTPAITLGIDLWPTRNAGIRFSADWSETDVGGTSTPYDVHLEYEARQPPGYELRPYVVERTTPWPDPDGDLQRLTLALSGLARWAASPRVSAVLSGGVTSTRISGDIDSLGFSTYWLGGHSVLFSETYRIGTSLEPTWVTGLDLGAAIEYALGGRTALVVGYRWLGGSTARVPVRAREVLNAEEIITAMPIEEIEAQLAPGKVEIESSRSRVQVGIKVSF
jgi:hypothetical protein